MDREERAIIDRMVSDMLRKRSGASRGECPAGVMHADERTFRDLLSKCEIVLADFWAEWCGPCRMVEPVVESLAHRYSSRLAVVKLNVDENPMLASEYGVLSIPTLILFHRGVEFKRFVGYYPGLARELDRAIRALLS